MTIKTEPFLEESFRFTNQAFGDEGGIDDFTVQLLIWSYLVNYGHCKSAESFLSAMANRTRRAQLEATFAYQSMKSRKGIPI